MNKPKIVKPRERKTIVEKLGLTDEDKKEITRINKKISKNLDYLVARGMQENNLTKQIDLCRKLGIERNELDVLGINKNTKEPTRPGTIVKLQYLASKFGVQVEDFFKDDLLDIKNNKKVEVDTVKEKEILENRIIIKVEDETALTKFNLSDELIVETFENISYDEIKQKVKHNNILLLEIAERKYVKEFKLKDLYSDNTSFSLKSLSGVENETDIINKSWEELEKITQIKFIGRVVQVIKYL